MDGTVTASLAVEIDPRITGHRMEGVQYWLIRGRVLSTEPVAHVLLLREGREAARLEFGADYAGRRLPDGRLSAPFHLDLLVPADAAPAPGAFALSAATRGGAAAGASYAFEVPPGQADRAHVVRGQIGPAADGAEDCPPLMLMVERATGGPGGQVQVTGWVVSESPVLAVQALDGEALLGRARINLPREDIAAARPMYPNAAAAGFQIALGPDAPAEIAVQAITQSGACHRLRWRLANLAEAPPEPPPEPPAPPPDPRREIHLHCDFALLSAAGELWVEGWAVCAAGIAQVAVELDGTKVGEAEIGRPRPDLSAAFPAIPFARLAGFRFRAPVPERFAGRHELRLRARNGLDDTHEAHRPVVAGDMSEAPAGTVKSDSEEEFMFRIDHPDVVDDAVPGPIAGRLTIGGWVVARSGVAQVTVSLDGARLGDAHCGQVRADVHGAYPDWPDSLRSGFAFHCPPRMLVDGAHTVELRFVAKNGLELGRRFAITVRQTEEASRLGIRRRMPQAEIDLGLSVLAARRCRPRFRLLIAAGAVPDPEALGRTLRTLALQAYEDWDATILVRGTRAEAAAKAVVAAEPDLEGRARVLRGKLAAIDDSDLAGVLAPGDELGCDALLELALAHALHPAAELIHADEMRPVPKAASEGADRREPFFKPDFSPDLLLSTNYIGRPWVATGAALRRAGASVRTLVERGEYDALLRLAEIAGSVRHIPKLLAETGPRDTSGDEAALQAAAERRGIAAEVTPGFAPGIWRFRRTRRAEGRVSVVIPTCAAKGHIRACLETLRAGTAYPDVEIVCVDNIPPAEAEWKAWLHAHADVVVATDEPFNWSRFNNLGAKAASGAFLLFLNDDVEITDPGWLDALLEHAQRPEVGIVGARLLYPDGTVQHAGMFLAEPGIGRHAFRFARADEPGYFGLALMQRNVMAVTGACMLVRREVFDALGGFDETHEIVNNDLDFCLRAHQAGKLTVLTPHATLLHHEAASRENLPDTFHRERFFGRWAGAWAAGDPYFSPRLLRGSDDFRPDEEPAETVIAGRLYDPARIRRILAVKLDHIGDLLTALPAIRRLRAAFPAARLCLLASKAARAIIAAEPAIDELIEFQFFHPRSELGKLELAEDELAALRTRLAAYRFDLAVDLRKQPDTRAILCESGARWLAGFDRNGAFPFLDIVSEWEDDERLQRKRTHVSTDLVGLVEAIVRAGDVAHAALVTPGEDGPPEFLPDDVRRLFDRPVVAVHPGAGNRTKQWPESYFAALIDMLVVSRGMNAVLIGGPDEAGVGETVLAALTHRDSATSLIGRTGLAELPAVLRACSLYIGNDSGPKHIAAALGVPTIGVHSGVVDAVEWAPLAPAALAVRRHMNCGPCYTAREEDCPRALACLRELEPNAVKPMAEALLALRKANRTRLTA